MLAQSTESVPENKVQRGVTVTFNLLQPQVKASSAICQSHTRLVAALLHQMTLIRATAGPLPTFIKLLTNMALGPPQHDSLQKLHERQGPIRAMLLKRLQQQVVPVGARVVRLVSQELQETLQARVTQGECFFPRSHSAHKPCSPTVGTAACLHCTERSWPGPEMKGDQACMH